MWPPGVNLTPSFRTGGDENAASIIQRTGKEDAIEQPKLVPSTQHLGEYAAEIVAGENQKPDWTVAGLSWLQQNAQKGC
jgi:hypothetical protein